MYLSVLLPSLFALFALYKNKLTIPAVILAWILGFIICYLGDYFAFAALAMTFILTIASDKIKSSSGEKRNIYQIICNVLIASLSIVLYRVFNNEDFYIIYYCVIGSSLADTLASSIGLLSKGKVFNPLSLKEMKKGESGAVSLLGYFASFMGGVIIGFIYFIGCLNYKIFLLIAFMSLLGSYLDSVFGSTLQGRFICIKCNCETEDYIHCGVKAKLLKGYKFINNNVVNFFNNLFIFIISFILLQI